MKLIRNRQTRTLVLGSIGAILGVGMAYLMRAAGST